MIFMLDALDDPKPQDEPDDQFALGQGLSEQVSQRIAQVEAVAAAQRVRDEREREQQELMAQAAAQTSMEANQPAPGGDELSM